MCQIVAKYFSLPFKIHSLGQLVQYEHVVCRFCLSIYVLIGFVAFGVFWWLDCGSVGVPG